MNQKAKLFLLLVLLSSACNTVRIKSVTKPDTDFTEYNTYCWIDGCEERYEGPDYAMSSEQMQSIKEAITQNLKKKDYQNDVNNPDLLIGFHVIVNEQQTSLSDNSEILAPYRNSINYWDGYEYYYNQNKLYKFLKGSLVIDIIEAGTGDVIWQSTAVKYMEIKQTLSKEQLARYIEKAMKSFPDRYSGF